jgi:peptidoglycan/xylan/chitin deacetylase (PgdA/CDA1 family)
MTSFRMAIAEAAISDLACATAEIDRNGVTALDTKPGGARYPVRPRPAGLGDHRAEMWQMGGETTLSRSKFSHRRYGKNRVQHAVRAAHVFLLRRRLPEKLGIYCHSAAGNEHRLVELLEFLGEQGYSFAAPGAFLSTPGKTAFLSFDDNYGSWPRLLPIFDRYGIHVTFYVNSWPFRDRVDEGDVKRYLAILRSEEETTLSTDELRELAAAGHVIGAHTRTHPVLTALVPDAAREEIRVSKSELESILQRPVEHFAYPFGMRRHFSELLRNYCRSLGFATIANAIPCLQYARSQPDSLNRSGWLLNQPFAFNLDNLRVDGRLFHLLTGRSPVGGAPEDSDE